MEGNSAISCSSSPLAHSFGERLCPAKSSEYTLNEHGHQLAQGVRGYGGDSPCPLTPRFVPFAIVP